MPERKFHLAVLQPAAIQRLALDRRASFQNFLQPPGIHLVRAHVENRAVRRRVVGPHEFVQFFLKFVRRATDLQAHRLFDLPVESFDLALRLRVIRRPEDVPDAAASSGTVLFLE